MIMVKDYLCQKNGDGDGRINEDSHGHGENM